MMDKYKEEMSSVHAPVDLILKTKEAVKQEEIKYQEEKNNTVVNKVSADLNIDEKDLSLENNEEASDEILDYTNEKVVAFRKKVGVIRLVSGIVAAAAVVTFIILAAGINRVGKSNGDDVGKLASGKQEQESSELTDDKQFLVEELANTDVPEEFKDAEELTEGNITYRMIDSTDSGKMVFVIHENKGYIFKFKATNIRLILPEIMNYFE